MKRKIILGLLLQTAVLLVLGVFVARTSGAAMEHTNQSVRLHHVEHLREQYLLQLKAVRSDLVLQELRGQPGPGTVAPKLAAMVGAVGECSACHHSEQVTRRLERLRLETDAFRYAVTAVGVHQDAPEPERRLRFETTLQKGDDLISEVEGLVRETTRNLEQHSRDALEDVARTRIIVYVLVGLGPLVSALLGLVWISSLTRPFGVLLDATRRLEAGDLDHRVTGLRDEFAVLEHSFNEMATSLRDQMQQMQRAEQLVAVGELAAGLVHEIKNPLAGIKNAVAILSDEASLSAEDASLLQKVAREVVGLEELLRTFLAFARPARPQPIDLEVNEVVEHVVGFYLRSGPGTSSAARPVSIRKALAPVPRTHADPLQLRQILVNLLLNAAEAMPSGGEITVSTWFDADAGEVLVEVSDTGRGVDPDHAAELFKPFFTTKPGGTGLGLAVSKRLAEQQGGSITFANRPGGGSVFRVHLPATAASLQRIA